VFKRIQNLGIPVLTVLALLIVFSLFFLFEFFSANPTSIESDSLSDERLQELVSTLLVNADPDRGEALLITYTCVACHRAGAENGVAPPFVGIAERAGERRVPLSAAAYIYESIVHPSAYLVEGYAAAMPQNFDDQLSDEELGDIIAYLLTPDAH
jgi:mono/diheme cytochrome c family protein